MSAWLKSLPSDWSIADPRRHFKERREASRPADVHLTPSQHHGVLSQADYMAKTGSKVVLNLSAPDNMKRVEPGDFIAHLRSFQGGLEKSDLPGKVSTAYTVIEPLPSADSRFYKWVLKSPAYIQVLSSSLEQLRDGQSIKFGDFAAIHLPMPPLEEQRRIADFLDDRVARIDQIIAARRRQGVLVESARKESLRQLTDGAGAAKGWSRPRVAHVFRTGSGSTPPSERHEYYDGGVPWVNTGDVLDGPLATTARTVSESALAEFSTLVRYPAGSLVIAMYGQGATKGRAALLETAACVNQACCVLQGDSLLLQWAFHWFRAHKPDIVELANGAGQPNLSQGIIRSVRLELPARKSVAGRLKEIEAREAESAGVLGAIERQTGTLQEYKQSLITAAVTGELDVTTARSGVPG